MSTQHTADFLDIQQFLAAQQAPEVAIQLGSREVWYVRQTQFDFQAPNNGDHDWTLVKSGDLIRIPLLPYRTANMEVSKVISGAMDLQRRYDEMFPQVVRTHMIIGEPVEDLRPAAESFRFWVGFAVRVQ